MSNERRIANKVRTFLSRGNSITDPEISDTPLKVYELSPDYPNMQQAELIRMKGLTLADIASLEEQQSQNVGNQKIDKELQLARNILADIDKELNHRWEMREKDFKYE